MSIYLGNHPDLGSEITLPRRPGRLHISRYNEMEAEREYAAWLCGEDYRYRVPETDGAGYLLTPTETGTRNLESLIDLYRRTPDANWSLEMPPDIIKG